MLNVRVCVCVCVHTRARPRVCACVCVMPCHGQVSFMTHTHTHARNIFTNLYIIDILYACIYTHTGLMALCLGLPWWACSRKVKLIWILLKQETASGSGISWAICKSAHRSRPITMPAPHPPLSFYSLDALPAAQPTLKAQALKAQPHVYMYLQSC